jgi:hypothetical protein
MRIAYIKDFKRGDKIKYLFPNPRITGRDFIFGTVHRIGKTYIEVRSEDTCLMNLSQKHLNNIEYVEREVITGAN